MTQIFQKIHKFASETPDDCKMVVPITIASAILTTQFTIVPSKLTYMNLKTLHAQRTLTFLLAVSLILLSFSAHLQAQQVKLMTYNIKNDLPKDGPNNWESRKGPMLKMLTQQAPALFGMQEAFINQVEFLYSNMPHYQYIGVGRDNGALKGEFCAIMFDTIQFRVQEQGNFWLSATPQSPSLGWDAAYPRICTYGLFENKLTQQKIWVFNTHLDHKGVVAQQESCKLLLAKIQEINQQHYGVILMGDFNQTAESAGIQLVAAQFEDSRSAVSTAAMLGGTFNGFDAAPARQRIDYVFVQNLAVVSYDQVSDKMANSNYLSDHFPVTSTVYIRNQAASK
jgi:endonuclease/exonuclease/phosphatase family metal-dependent hydrolase